MLFTAKRPLIHTDTRTTYRQKNTKYWFFYRLNFTGIKTFYILSAFVRDLEDPSRCSLSKTNCGKMREAFCFGVIIALLSPSQLQTSFSTLRYDPDSYMLFFIRNWCVRNWGYRVQNLKKLKGCITLRNWSVVNSRNCIFGVHEKHNFWKNSSSKMPKLIYRGFPIDHFQFHLSVCHMLCYEVGDEHNSRSISVCIPL